MIRIDTSKEYIIVIFAGLVSIITILIFDNSMVHVGALWLFCIVAMTTMKFEISHPYVWFSVGFALYSTGYAIVYSMGLGDYGYSKNNILYPAVAMLICLITIGTRKYDIENLQISDRHPSSFISTCSYAFGILLMICVVALATSGYLGKSEMKQANDPYYRLGVYCARYLTFFALLKICYVIKKSKRKQIEVISIILLSLPVLLFTLYTGERDAFIRYCAVMVFALYYLKVIKKRHFLFLIPAFMLVMTASVYFKYYFSAGTINTTLQGNNILYQFLRTDFISQGRNFQYLLNNPWTKNSQSFTLIITEMLYPFVPSGVFFSPDHWFNYEVHTGGFKGYAFTLVGTGYIIGGILGVVVLFIVVGIVIKALYKRSINGVYGLCAYIYSITTIIFSFRGSLNTIFVSIVRIVFISIFLCHIASRSMIKK